MNSTCIKTIYILAIYRCFTNVNLIAASKIYPKDDFPNIYVQETRKILEQLCSGPLKDEVISVFLPEDFENREIANLLLRNVGKPLKILDLKNDITKEEDLNENFVVVLVNIKSNSSILNNYHPFLEAKPVVAMSLSSDLDPLKFMSTPLISRSRSSVLFVPLPNRSRGRVAFKLHQDTGMNPHQTNVRSYSTTVWDPNNFQTSESLLKEKWNTLAGAHLKIASDSDDKPLVFENAEGEVTGLSIKILNIFAERMNFSYSTSISAVDGEWGSLENGSWTGMLGELYRKEGNLTFNYFTVTRERAQDFDFSVSYYTEGFGFALKIPAPFPQWMSLVFPFAIQVWACIGITLSIATVFFSLFTRFYKKERQDSVVQSFLQLLKPLIKQSLGSTKSNTGSHSLFTIVWWWTSFILAISYTCNFIAVLTVVKFPFRINLVKQLAESDMRIVMLDYGEFVPEALKESQDNILSKLGQKLDLVPYIKSAEDYNYGEALKMVLDEPYAHIETYSYLKLLYANFGVTDQVYVMKEQVYSGDLAFFFSKRTPWKHKFDDGIRRMVEAGLIRKWYDDIMEKEIGVVVEKRKGLASPLSLKHFQGAFYILGILLGVSFLIFIGEVFFPSRESDSEEDVKDIA